MAEHDIEIIVRPRTRAGRGAAVVIRQEVARAVSHLEVGEVTLQGPDWGYTNGERIAQLDRLTALEQVANHGVRMLVKGGR